MKESYKFSPSICAFVHVNVRNGLTDLKVVFTDELCKKVPLTFIVYFITNKMTNIIIKN